MNNKVDISKQDYKKYSEKKDDKIGYVIALGATIAIFIEKRPTLDSDIMVLNIFNGLFLIVCVATFILSLRGMFFSGKIEDTITAVEGKIESISNTGGRQRRDICSLEIETLYDFDAESSSFIKRTSLDEENNKGRSNYYIPPNLVKNLSIDDKVQIIYDIKDEKIYDYKVVETNNKVVDKNEKKIRKIKSPTRKMNLPQSYIEFRDSYSKRRSDVLIFGETISARSYGIGKSIKWDIVISAVERYSIKSGEKYDDFRSKCIGQEPVKKGTNLDYYEVEKHYTFEKYKDSNNKFMVGDKVAIVTNINRRQAHHIEKLENINNNFS